MEHKHSVHGLRASYRGAAWVIPQNRDGHVLDRTVSNWDAAAVDWTGRLLRTRRVAYMAGDTHSNYRHRIT